MANFFDRNAFLNKFTGRYGRLLFSVGGKVTFLKLRESPADTSHRFGATGLVISQANHRTKFFAPHAWKISM